MKKGKQTGLMTVPEAAEYLGISEGAVRRLEQKGDLPRMELNSGRVLFARATVERFEAGIKTPTEAEVFRLASENRRLRKENDEMHRILRDIYQRASGAILDGYEKGVMEG